MFVPRRRPESFTLRPLKADQRSETGKPLGVALWAPLRIVGVLAFLAASTSSFGESHTWARDYAARGSEALQESLRNAIDDEEARGRITVELRISGGAPGEAYQLLLRVSGDGRVHYRYRDELRGVSERIGTVELPGEKLAELITQIHASGAIDTAGSMARFAPDTTVGVLEVTDGRSHFRALFAADPEQAEVQGLVPSPRLRAVVEALYAIGREVIGVESVRA